MTVDNKQAEYRHYSDVDTAFVGKSIRVVDMPNGKEDVIGCTSINDYIHVNYSHPIMDDLTDEQKIVFRCGVNAHELLHKLLSDFVALNKHIKAFPESEQPIFLQIQNVILILTSVKLNHSDNIILYKVLYIFNFLINI